MPIISINIDEEMDNRINKAMADYGITNRSNFLENRIRDGLDEYEKKHKESQD